MKLRVGHIHVTATEGYWFTKPTECHCHSTFSKTLVARFVSGRVGGKVILGVKPYPHISCQHVALNLGYFSSYLLPLSSLGLLLL